MPAYCGYAWVPIVGMPGHRLRPLFHEIVGWNAMDLMREFLQKSRVEGLTNHGGYATITPTSIERLATLNGKSHKTPVRRQGTASETTPRIITHRRPVARPRMGSAPLLPPPLGLVRNWINMTNRGPCRNSGTRRHMLAWAERALRRSCWETKDHQLTERKCLN